jgi:hypothetical protein
MNPENLHSNTLCGIRTPKRYFSVSSGNDVRLLSIRLIDSSDTNGHGFPPARKPPSL